MGYNAYHNIGGIEVVCGPMFSGKTEELIRRVKELKSPSNAFKFLNLPSMFVMMRQKLLVTLHRQLNLSQSIKQPIYFLI